jgi:hypothetical protein
MYQNVADPILLFLAWNVQTLVFRKTQTFYVIKRRGTGKLQKLKIAPKTSIYALLYPY